MERFTFSNFFVVALYAFGTSDSIQIKSCNSNKINVVRNNTKSIIKFEKEQNISLDTSNANIKLWCDSDVLVDKCILEHLSSGVTCEKTIPISCGGETCLHNERITFSSTSRRRCEFHFESLRDTGKNYILTPYLHTRI